MFSMAHHHQSGCVSMTTVSSLARVRMELLGLLASSTLPRLRPVEKNFNSRVSLSNYPACRSRSRGFFKSTLGLFPLPLSHQQQHQQQPPTQLRGQSLPVASPPYQRLRTSSRVIAFRHLCSATAAFTFCHSLERQAAQRFSGLLERSRGPAAQP